MTTAAEIFVGLCFIGCGVVFGVAIARFPIDKVAENELATYRKVADAYIPDGVSVVTVDGKDYVCARSGSGLAICPK